MKGKCDEFDKSWSSCQADSIQYKVRIIEEPLI